MHEDYTGLGAVAWDLFARQDAVKDLPFFQSIVESRSGNALDVGCGTGRLLLPMLEAGLDVDGVDASEDQLAICRRNAEERDLAPRLFCQRVQALEVPRRYDVIFVPCGTFQLVVDLNEAAEALRRMRAHLSRGGGALVLTVFNRWRELAEERPGEWTLRARRPLPDRTEVAKHVRVNEVKLLEQTLSVTVRYQHFAADGALIEEQLCDAPERWYFRHEMELMLRAAGFGRVRVYGNYTFEPPRDDDYVMCFVAE